MLYQCKILFESWNDNELMYCHWKGNEHIAEGLNGKSDLDVFLKPENKERGCEILKEIGFIQYKSQFGYRYPNVEDWLGFDKETGSLIHLHLHFALMSGHTGLKEFELPWADECLKTRQKDTESGVYVMNSNLELVTLYTRLILKSKYSNYIQAKRGLYSTSTKFKRESAFLKNKVEWEEVETITKKYFGRQWDKLLEIIKSEEINSKLFLQLRTIIMDSMKANARFKGLSLTFRKAYYSTAIYIREGLRKRTKQSLITRKIPILGEGVSVAFLGQDGSGKSTVTIEIEKWLNWKIEAKRFYLGSGDHYNSFLKNFINKSVQIKHKISKPSTRNDNEINKNETKHNASKKRKKTILTFISSTLESLYFLMVARRAYKELRRSVKYRLKGGMPLFDRFPQVQFEGISDGPKIANLYERTGLDFFTNKLMAKIEYSYFKRMQKWQPELVFKLLLPPEESIRRKPEENLENVRQKHKITKELIFPNALVYEVDATQDYQKELLYIKNKIWEATLKK